MAHELFDKPFSCFITGTDTEIGKTLVASAIVYKQAQNGFRVAGMKPVAAGAQLLNTKWHNEDVDSLMRAASVNLDSELVCPYLFRTPIAPHIASEVEGLLIDPEQILKSSKQIEQVTDAVVVEGVGGFRVPLTQDFDTADLAVSLDLPVILVVGLRLGCINHALLTIEAIEARGLRLLGWVANSLRLSMEKEADNLLALKQRIQTPLIGHVRYLSDVSFVEAAKYL